MSDRRAALLARPVPDSFDRNSRGLELAPALSLTMSYQHERTHDMGSKDTLINGLNEDLAHEYAAVILYRTYASAVTGPFRQELRSFFSGEIPDELGHAQLLADKIVALGGTPTVEAAEVKNTDDPKEMLQNALDDEIATIARYVERRRQAEEAGEPGLAVDLDDVIADESKHRDELRLMLLRWK
jgi:bacterioferritin